jgi:multiple sugar transport system substrate-binding protein
MLMESTQLLPARQPTRRQFLRMTLTAATGIGAAALISACAPPGAAPSGEAASPDAAQKVVNVFESCWGGQNIDAGKKLYADLSETNPEIEVEERFPVGENWTEDFLSAVAGGDQLDVVLWCGSPFAFMDGGKLADLNPLMEADASFDKEDFYESLTGLLVKDGHTYGWPYNYATTVMYYNTKLFQEAGVDFPTVEWTWNDLLAAAQQLTNDTGDPTTQQWGYLFRRIDLEHMSQSFGGNWVNADEKRCDFTKPETIEALQFFSDLIYTHKVSPQAEQIGGQSETAMFASGRVAMVGLPEWGLNEFNVAHDEQGLEYDVMLMPNGPAGRTTRLRPGEITIMQDTKNLDAAWEVFKYAVSPEYQRAMQVEIPESPPPRKSVNEYKFMEFTSYPESRALFLESPNYGIYPFYDLRYGKELEDVIWPLMDTLMLGSELNAAALADQLCAVVDDKLNEVSAA